MFSAMISIPTGKEFVDSVLANNYRLCEFPLNFHIYNQDFAKRAISVTVSFIPKVSDHFLINLGYRLLKLLKLLAK